MLFGVFPLLVVGLTLLEMVPQAIARDPANTSAQGQPKSQAFHSIVLGMTKEQVEKLMGKAAQSTDTLWQYAYDDGTSVGAAIPEEQYRLRHAHSQGCALDGYGRRNAPQRSGAPAIGDRTSAALIARAHSPRLLPSHHSAPRKCAILTSLLSLSLAV